MLFFTRNLLWVLTSIGVFFAVSVGGNSVAAASEDSYPWCTQGSTLHCYYANRAQCEETVDYHGFCVANPDYPENYERKASPR